MNQQVRIAAEQPGLKARFTAAEFLRMVDAGAFEDMKVELIAGELYRMTPPMSTHARLQGDLIFSLKTLLRERSELTVFGGVGIILDDETVVCADLAVARLPKSENRRLRPDDVDLVIEVAITSTAKDSGIKRLAYAAASIPYYWMVDGKRGVVHLYSQPADGDYAEVSTVRFGQSFSALGMIDTITID